MDYISNPAPCLSPCIEFLPVHKATWDEVSSKEEIIQVNALLGEASLNAVGLTGAALALSFCKPLTQPIKA